jgi:hypothetical protein
MLHSRIHQRRREICPSRVPTTGRDGGFALTEVIIAVVISGLLIAVLASAISVMLRVTPTAELRLVESKNLSFLGRWITLDTARAVSSYSSPSDVTLRSDLAADELGVSFNATPALPGTNVLTMVVANGARNESERGEFEIISYRYVFDEDEWQLKRVRIIEPGTSGEQRSQVRVAGDLPAPPAGFTQGQSVDFAFEVGNSSQADGRAIIIDLEMRFASGATFKVGGTGLPAGGVFPAYERNGLLDPSVPPPPRCGGRVALVLDTSWSVPAALGGRALEDAATGFIDAFVGTPTEMTVMGFDAIAYQLYPNLNGARGSYISLLDGAVGGAGRADVVAARDNVLALPDRDTSGKSGPYYYGDTRAAIGWSQIRTTENGQAVSVGGTNWADALHAPFFTQAGIQRTTLPELVVLITDGQPNIQRSDVITGVASAGSALQAAVAAADAGRSTGSRIVGVLVGPDAGTDLEDNLAAVVGPTKWTGTGPDDLGNAADADYFVGSFSQLGGILRSIVSAECGGTVTIRKGIDGSVGDDTGTWTYTTDGGGPDLVLDTAVAASVTFSYSFATNTIVRSVLVTEEPRAGYTFVRGDCQIGGQPIAPSKIVQKPDGVAGVQIQLAPDEAVSCVMVSTES